MFPNILRSSQESCSERSSPAGGVTSFALNSTLLLYCVTASFLTYCSAGRGGFLFLLLLLVFYVTSPPQDASTRQSRARLRLPALSDFLHTRCYSLCVLRCVVAPVRCGAVRCLLRVLPLALRLLLPLRLLLLHLTFLFHWPQRRLSPAFLYAAAHTAPRDPHIQAFPIDVTRLGFVHEDFLCSPSLLPHCPPPLPQHCT